MQRHKDDVLFWWQKGEFADQRGDVQTGASYDQPGSDLLQDDTSIAQMQQAPLGEPPTAFDVRSVYDSRPVNGYDFNYSGSLPSQNLYNNPWTIEFNVPNGYRAVPRKWDVFYDTPPSGPSYNSTVTLLQQGAAVPNNGPIIIGMGTNDPIESFFLCEENTTFGITGNVVFTGNGTSDSVISVNVQGNLIPVSEVALPFSIANPTSNPALLHSLLGD